MSTPTPTRFIVEFRRGKRGDVMAFLDSGKVAFPERRGPQPQVGDEWEVSIAGENPAGTVAFLKLHCRVSTAAEREEAERRAQEAELARRQQEEAAARHAVMVAALEKGREAAARLPEFWAAVYAAAEEAMATVAIAVARDSSATAFELPRGTTLGHTTVYGRVHDVAISAEKAEWLVEVRGVRIEPHANERQRHPVWEWPTRVAFASTEVKWYHGWTPPAEEYRVEMARLAGLLEASIPAGCKLGKLTYLEGKEVVSGVSLQWAEPRFVVCSAPIVEWTQPGDGFFPMVMILDDHGKRWNATIPAPVAVRNFRYLRLPDGGIRVAGTIHVEVPGVDAKWDITMASIDERGKRKLHDFWCSPEHRLPCPIEQAMVLAEQPITIAEARAIIDRLAAEQRERWERYGCTPEQAIPLQTDDPVWQPVYDWLRTVAGEVPGIGNRRGGYITGVSRSYSRDGYDYELVDDWHIQWYAVIHPAWMEQLRAVQAGDSRPWRSPVPSGTPGGTYTIRLRVGGTLWSSEVSTTVTWKEGYHMPPFDPADARVSAIISAIRAYLRGDTETFTPPALPAA